MPALIYSSIIEPGINVFLSFSSAPKYIRAGHSDSALYFSKTNDLLIQILHLI